ncbi:tripartite tricarboxylate transporter substrate binding protein [Variovorax sp. tm]|uniref:tripartite tricarboxylate transporter substrate binding protein n=1 Tax=Variovorax atrisoli TaxID=3394203 RepID=UPI003A8085DB
MARLLKFIAAAATAAALVSPLARAADPYPAKPIELTVAFQPGGGTDSMARAFADAARPYLSQPIVVINKAGASGAIGLGYVANSPADGYKMAMVFAELLVIPYLNLGKVTYEDFQPIARFTSDPSSITVRADAPWKTVEEFLAYAKANPGKVTVSNAGNGSIPQLAAASLGEKIGTSFSHVPYLGSAPAILGLLGGQVDATFVAYGELKAHVESGKLRTLAVMGDKRLPGLDNVPTIKEKGIDLTSYVWRGLAVPKNTPPQVVNKLREVAAKVANEPAFKDALAKQNLTFSYADAPEFRSQMATQSAGYQKLIPTLKLN